MWALIYFGIAFVAWIGLGLIVSPFWPLILVALVVYWMAIRPLLARSEGNDA